MSHTRSHPIEHMTEEALAASEAGHWDLVASLYQRRSVEFEFKKLSPLIIKRLIQIDQQIKERVELVQAATKQNIEESQRRRRKLQQWRQQVIPSIQTGSRFTQSV